MNGLNSSLRKEKQKTMPINRELIKQLEDLIEHFLF